MPRTVMIGFALASLVLGTPVVLEGQERAATALEDTILVVAPRVPWEGRRFTLLSLPPVYRPLDSKPVTHLSLFEPRLHSVRLSRFACTAYGLDRGANAGLILGGLGSLAGFWDEKTAMYLVGAGAALGALWGGTAGAENPAFNMRVKFEEP